MSAQPGTAELFSQDEALDKFQAAGDVANQALKALMAKCVPGADVATLCQESDEHIKKLCANIYRKKPVSDGRCSSSNDDPHPHHQYTRGVSFPTCISINEIMGHFCPLTPGTELKAGDVVKL